MALEVGSTRHAASDIDRGRSAWGQTAEPASLAPSGQIVEATGARRAGRGIAGSAADDGHGQRVRRGIEVAKGEVCRLSAQHLWRRLDSMDFMNRGMLFAATLFLCFV